MESANLVFFEVWFPITKNNLFIEIKRIFMILAKIYIKKINIS